MDEIQLAALKIPAEMLAELRDDSNLLEPATAPKTTDIPATEPIIYNPVTEPRELMQTDPGQYC